MTAQTGPQAHPQVVEVMDQMRQLQTVLDGVVTQTSSETFTGTDEANTVSVTVDGHHSLTNLYIEDGLLRLGALVVEQRLNVALGKASAAATETTTATCQQLFATMVEITGKMKTGLGLD